MSGQKISAKLSKYVFVFAIFILLIAVRTAFCEETIEINEKALVNQVVQQWIAIAQEQYKRSQYSHAEKSLNRAQEYYEYLSNEELKQISSFLEKTRTAMFQKEQVLNSIKTAEWLIKQDRPIEAKAHLTEVKKSEFLSEREKQQVSAALKKIDKALNVRKKEMTQIFAQSKKYYKDGDFYNAQKGFTLVARSGMYVPKKGMTAEDYLMKIERISTEQRVLSLPDTTKTAVSTPAEIEEKDSGSILDIAAPIQKFLFKPKPKENVIGNTYDLEDNNNDIRKLKRSYIKAVIKDTKGKVMLYIGKGQFRRAKEKIENTENLLEINRIEIGEEFYQQNYKKIKRLSIQMAKQEDLWLRNKSIWKK